MSTDELTRFGFTFGPMTVERVSKVEWRKGRGEAACVKVTTQYRALEIYASPTGRSLRVFEDGRELA